MKNLIQWGSILMALAVGLGAFGAHALADILEASGRLETYKTAVLYHFIHSLGLLIVGLIAEKYSHRFVIWAGRLMGFGILFFSGSLYILCFTNIGVFGAITPIGGVLFIAGWVLVFMGVKKS